MSSTNRGYDRHKADYYVTPAEEIKKFLSVWLCDLQKEGDYFGDNPEKAYWLDPCAGGDENNPMSYPSVLEELGITPHTIDIREDSRADTITDYLEWEKTSEDTFHIIITNPPFYLAQEIIEKALQDVEDGGYVVMLLRLNFFGSKTRFPFWQKNMPTHTYVHHKRMSFTESNKTDSIEYMHCVWRKGDNPLHTKLSII